MQIQVVLFFFHFKSDHDPDFMLPPDIPSNYSASGIRPGSDPSNSIHVNM